MENVTEIPLAERIKQMLAKYGSTQRWFAAKLVDAGLEMSDTKLSNRMTGAIDWTPEEIIKINEVLDSLS